MITHSHDLRLWLNLAARNIIDWTYVSSQFRKAIYYKGYSDRCQWCVI